MGVLYWLPSFALFLGIFWTKAPLFLCRATRINVGNSLGKVSDSISVVFVPDIDCQHPVYAPFAQTLLIDLPQMLPFSRFWL